MSTTAITTAATTLALRQLDNGSLLPLAGEKITIGAGQSCTLRLAAPEVKTLHCLVTASSDGYTIRRWSDGTLLNGEVFGEASLTVGDRLTIGSLEFELVDPQQVEEAETAHAPVDELETCGEEQAECAEADEVADAAVAEPTSDCSSQQENQVRETAVQAVGTNRQRAKRLAGALRDSRRDYKHLEASLQELESRVASIESERANLAEERDELANQLRQLSNQLSSTRDEFAAARETFELREQELTDRVAELEQEIVERNDLIEELKRELIRQQSEATQVEPAAVSKTVESWGVDSESSTTEAVADEPPSIEPGEADGATSVEAAEASVPTADWGFAAETPATEESTSLASSEAPAELSTAVAAEAETSAVEWNLAAEASPAADTTSEEPIGEALEEVANMDWPVRRDETEASLWGSPSPNSDEPTTAGFADWTQPTGQDAPEATPAEIEPPRAGNVWGGAVSTVAEDEVAGVPDASPVGDASPAISQPTMTGPEAIAASEPWDIEVQAAAKPVAVDLPVSEPVAPFANSEALPEVVDSPLTATDPVAEQVPVAIEQLSQQEANTEFPAAVREPTDEEELWGRLNSLRAEASVKLHSEVEHDAESVATDFGASPGLKHAATESSIANEVAEPPISPAAGSLWGASPTEGSVAVDEATDLADEFSSDQPAEAATVPADTSPELPDSPEGHESPAIAPTTLFDAPSEPEVDESPKAPVEPVSYLDKYRHLLEEDGIDAQPEPPVEREPLVPEPSPIAAADASSDDESIEDYMAKMMARLRGSEPEASRPEPPAVPKPTPVQTPTPMPKPELAEVATPSTPAVDAPIAPPTEPLASLDQMKSSTKAEPPANMNALRDLANSSARQAIDIANTRRAREKAHANLLLCLFAGAAGAYMVWESHGQLGLSLFGGAFSVAAAGYWASRTLRALFAPSDPPPKPVEGDDSAVGLPIA